MVKTAVRLAGLALIAAVLPACGGGDSGRCPTPGLKASPTTVKKGEKLTVTADPPFKACKDKKSGSVVRPLGPDVFEVELALVPARIENGGSAVPAGDQIPWASTAFDDKDGEFTVTKELPATVVSGDWIVVVDGQSEYRAAFKVAF